MNPYEILGVAQTATQDEIKKAYRGLAKKLHPDLNPGNKEAERKFKDLSAAHDLIGTSETRGKFDRGETDEQRQEQARQAQQNGYHENQRESGRYAQSFHQSFGGEAGRKDFFENLFRAAGVRGDDQLYQMEVDFKDAALGAEREIALPTGKTLRVKIPAALESGTKLRFRGQGGPGTGQGAPGDVLVEIAVRPLAGFKRDGKNIEVEVPLSFQEGVLGGEIKIPTLDGQVMLKVPAGVTTGTRLRVRGKGAGGGEQRGDQIVVLKVVLPKNPSPELQAAIRAWDGKFNYDPRSEV